MNYAFLALEIARERDREAAERARQHRMLEGASDPTPAVGPVRRLLARGAIRLSWVAAVAAAHLDGRASRESRAA